MTPYFQQPAERKAKKRDKEEQGKTGKLRNHIFFGHLYGR
jgi:hypothetical protein